MNRFLSILVFIFVFSASLGAAEEIKRRILVIPFDNVQSNANYNWMSESFSDNLKTEILKSNRFVVMDATLLRKINPDLQFQNLTDNEATDLALKLNCEAAIIGRYFITRKGGKENVLIQTEGVDALSKKSVLIKSQYADIDGEIFTKVQTLAESIASEFNEKLPAISGKDLKRDAKLERLIYRMENPPKGFFDSFALNLAAPATPPGTNKPTPLEPEFDIDTFEYVIQMPEKKGQAKTEFSYSFTPWGKAFKPSLRATGVTCRGQKCVIDAANAELIFTKPKGDDSVAYRIRLTQAGDTELPAADKSGARVPLIGRWWATAGYSLSKSLSVLNNANPPTLVPDGQPPLDAMKGLMNFEAGVAPGRYQLPAGLQWAIAAQTFYGKADFPLSGGTTLGVSLLSLGGGLRFDRPFMLGKFYAISPVIGFYVHYQKYFSTWSTGYSTMALVPEIGFNQYVRLGKLQLMLSALGGGFYYNQQNLSYVRVNLGVEYAYR